jgi:hypothetical protein
VIEFFLTSLWVALSGGLTWLAFFIPSLYGLKLSLPAKIVLSIPVAAMNIFLSAKIVSYLKVVVGL